MTALLKYFILERKKIQLVSASFMSYDAAERGRPGQSPISSLGKRRRPALPMRAALQLALAALVRRSPAAGALAAGAAPLARPLPARAGTPAAARPPPPREAASAPAARASSRPRRRRGVGRRVEHHRRLVLVAALLGARGLARAVLGVACTSTCRSIDGVRARRVPHSARWSSTTSTRGGAKPSAASSALSSGRA